MRIVLNPKTQMNEKNTPNHHEPQTPKALATRFVICIILLFLAPVASAQLRSQLWGENGELWNPQNSRLRDFTNVGYMSGNSAIPNWPVGVNVIDFGAVPNDGIDDTPAFRNAIAACPDNHAVLVPNGRYTILQQIIPNRNYFVLRGESMYGTILHCPKNLNEIYTQEIGYDPNDPGKRNTGVPKGFFRVTGGTHRSIENLTFEFRNQIKMGHWEHKGADAISYSGNTVDSWARNIYFKNVDHGVMMDKAQRISFLNMIFDHSVARPDISGNLNMAGWVGHMGINFGGAQYCLFHNIEFKGKYFHEIDLNNTPMHNVVSNVRGINMQVHHHGMGADYNLYTNIDVGRGDRSLLALADNRGQDQETHWNFRGDTTFDPSVVPENSIKNHVFVGFGAGLPTTITDTFWYENIDPEQLHPQNIYIAQMEKMLQQGKHLPAGPPPQPPSPYSGNVIVINPTDDNITKSGTPETVENPENVTIGLGGYYRFDLKGLNLDSIHKVRFRINAKGGKNTPTTLGVFSVERDDWTQQTINHNNRPMVGNVLNTVVIPADFSEEWFEFDITPHVRAEWADDKIVSLHLATTAGASLTGSFRTRENGNAPQLVIEKTPSPVAGAPAAPTGVRSESIIGNIRLDWEDNTEADVVSYNVYRHTASAEMNSYGEAVGMGLVTSDFVDICSVADWSVGMMRSDTVYYYRVTAVDSHGYESPASAEIIGTTLDPNNQPPVFNSNPAVLPAAVSQTNYSANLNTFASDPESDPRFFFKISGPSWLTVNQDGTLTGIPGAGDVGLNSFTVQVNARGGRAETVIRIQVEGNSNPPAAPAAPQGLVADSGNGVVQLNWNDNTEPDFGYYVIYRATVPSGAYEVVASNVTASQYSDTNVVNGTTYNYFVRAISNVSLQSANSNVVSATPVAQSIGDTNFLGGLLTTAANWSNGLPVGQLGNINVNATVDTSVILNGYRIIHTGGTISQTGIPALEMTNGSSWTTDGANATTSTLFRGFTLRSGSSFTLNQGTIHTTSGKDWTVYDAGSSITVNGGTLNLGRHLLLNGLAGASFTINGGVINGNMTTGEIGGRSIHDTAKTFNFNGGTTTTYRLDPGGDNTVFNFGGTSEGSLTASGFVGAFGANSFLNFLPGTRMSVTLTGSDEWAATQWNSGRLRFNGQGTAQLGSWAAVTTLGGLGAGTRFDYNSATETLRVIYVDVAPAAPANLASTAGDSVINLTWNANTEADFSGYNVYRSQTSGTGFVLIASGLTESHFEDTDVVNYTNYFYTVTVTDVGENESAFSSEVTATPIDLTPPDAPHGLVAKAGNGFNAIAWDSDCDCGETMAYYKLYRRTNSTGAFVVAASNLTSNSYIDGNLTNGTNYYYVLTAFDPAGNESMVSSQVSATPQTGAIVQSDFMGGDLADSAGWGFGSPNNGLFTGVVATNGTLASMLTNFNVIHTLGTISVTGIANAGFTGGSYTLDGGSWNAGLRGFNTESGAIITINSGTMTTGGNAHTYVTNSSFTLNGGSVLVNPSGSRSFYIGGSTYTQSGGVVQIGGQFGNTNIQSASIVRFNGGTFNAGSFNFQKPSVATFGGNSPGSVTVATATGLTYDWLTGSKMSLSITGTADWAQTAWTSGKLTYNGQGTSQFGTWSAVTSTGGLGGGYRFAYDNVTRTLTLTTAPSDQPPVAPTGLAISAGIGSITLNWADHPESDFASYKLYRSTTSGVIGTIRASGLTNSEFTDTQVVDHTTYYYVVSAVDFEGRESAYSLQKAGKPGSLSNHATAEIDVEGTLTGSVNNIDNSDNSYQTITEISDGATSRLEHVWLFDVQPAEVVTFYLEAHHSSNSEGDRFVFAYSTDDVNYIDMLTVEKTTDDNTSDYFTFPSGISGTVYVRVRDTDRSAGNTALNSMIIDRLMIESKTSSSVPTAASQPSPANGAVGTSDTPLLTWKTGRETVSHEVFFGTSPSPASRGTQFGNTFDPGLLLPQTTYYWSVRQTNSRGTTVGPVWSFTTGNVTPKLSTGLIENVGSTWQTLTLPRTYRSPVIVATVVYANKAVAPAVARLRNVTSSSVELCVQNPSGLPLSDYDVHLVAIDEGVYTMQKHGVKLEAIRVTSSGTNENNNWSNTKQVRLQPSNSYVTPVVLGQVMTANSQKWSVFWSSESNRLNPANASSIYVGKHVGEDTDLARSAETLGVIIVESGSGSIDGTDFIAAVGADTIAGTGDNAPYTYNLSGLSTASEVAISISGMDGNDGGWPVLLGTGAVSPTQLKLAIDEDQIIDTERKHPTEQVSYLLFE